MLAGVRGLERRPAPLPVAAICDDGQMASVNLTAFVPSRCDWGHYLGRGGRVIVGWEPCGCPPALADPARGYGHIWLRCLACKADGRDTVFYDPPHDLETVVPPR